MEWLDIAKGIGILLMVWGHASNGDALTHWLYFFHMPLFMLLSGYVLHVKGTYRDFLTKRVKSLLGSYALFFIISFALEWFYEFVFYAGHPMLPSFLRKAFELIWPAYGTGVSGSLWFLIALFWLVAGFGGLLALQCPTWAMCCLGLTLSMTAYAYCSVARMPFFLMQSALLSLFFSGGYALRQTCMWRSQRNTITGLIAAIGGGFLYLPYTGFRRLTTSG